MEDDWDETGCFTSHSECIKIEISEAINKVLNCRRINFKNKLEYEDLLNLYMRQLRKKHHPEKRTKKYRAIINFVELIMRVRNGTSIVKIDSPNPTQKALIEIAKEGNGRVILDFLNKPYCHNLVTYFYKIFS